MDTRRGVMALVGLVALAFAGAGPVAAQDDETYVYASYYECGPGQGAAVATLRDDWGPMIQPRIDAGEVAAWGVLTHDTGNPWSLAIYHVGSDLGTLNAAVEATIQAYFQAHPEEGQTFGAACPRHEDYVWTVATGSEEGAGIAQERASAALSVYWVCDEGREAVADLIVENLWAPVLDRQVAEGKIGSWGWLEHFLGGEYRRLLVVDGTDHGALLEARNEFIEATGAEDPGLAMAFSDVCNGHQDILWDIAVSAP